MTTVGTWNREMTWLDLADWRRRVAALYGARDQQVRQGGEPAAAALAWRAGKDALFAQHPQSPLADDVRPQFGGLPYYPYDPAWRVAAELVPLPMHDVEVDDATGGWQLIPAAEVRFAWDGLPQRLVVYWINVYGGGLFLPFRDGTSGITTYGGGRYLMDTVKGSDLYRPQPPIVMGDVGGRVILDFNDAYHPSCTYDVRWSCPLAPRENTLSFAVAAGERLSAG